MAHALAPAIHVALTTSPSTTQQPQTLTIKLDPADLGHVQVKIERVDDGPARVELSANRPETLQLLAKDHVQLSHALDQAGIPPAGRVLHFSLSQDTSGQSAASSGFGQAANFGAGNGSGQTAFSGGGRPQPGGAPATARQANQNDIPLSPTRLLRAGVDITA